MNDWIDRQPRVDQSTSKLPVIPSPKTESVSQLPNSLAEVDPLGVQPELLKEAAQASPPAAPLPASWNTTRSHRPSWSKRMSEWRDEWMDAFSSLKGVPSWLTSFVVHVILLIVLALLTLDGRNGSRIVRLEMGDSESVAELEMAEVMVEQDEDPLEALESDLEESQLESIETESSLEATQSLLAALKAGMADQVGAEGMDASRLELARGDGKSVSFFGAGAQGTKFVFVVDCSGSMEDEYRWEAAKRELKYAIEGLTISQKYFVYLYNSDVYNMFGNNKSKLLPANRWNRTRTGDWLDRQYPDGETYPWKAMHQALKLEPDAIFLLSDGELKDETVTLLRKYNADREESSYREGNKQIPIHTIFLGRGFGEETMRVIAEENGGSFTRASR